LAGQPLSRCGAASAASLEDGSGLRVIFYRCIVFITTLA
jgi:hypothetical protein